MAADQPITNYSDFLKALLSDRERFFDEVVEGVALRSKLRYAVVTIITLAGFFGLVAGAYSGPAQALSAGLKLPFLFFATFAVCFPAFFVVQVLVGSRLRLLQVAVLVFGALALTSVLLAAFVPITAFFLITGANYYFQHLLNIAIGAWRDCSACTRCTRGSAWCARSAAYTLARRSRSCGRGQCCSPSSAFSWPGVFGPFSGTAISPSRCSDATRATSTRRSSTP